MNYQTETGALPEVRRWFVNPGWCITGDRWIGQPPQDALAMGFSPIECGAIDAPAHIPRGSIVGISIHTGPLDPILFEDAAVIRRWG